MCDKPVIRHALVLTGHRFPHLYEVDVDRRKGNQTNLLVFLHTLLDDKV